MLFKKQSGKREVKLLIKTKTKHFSREGTLKAAHTV